MIKLKMVALLSLLLISEVTGCIYFKKDVDILETTESEAEVIPVSQEEIIVGEVVEEEPKEFNYYGLTEDELNLVYAVVMQEGGPTYESAEYVMSTLASSSS